MTDGRYITYRDGKNIMVPPIDELCLALKDKFMGQEKRIEHLEEKIKKLKDENWKDNELQSMKEQYDKMKEDYYRGFPISKEDYDKAIDWIEKHEETYHSRFTSFPRGGAIGGSYTWKFTPTSIGTFGSVKCSCGKSFTFQEEF